MKVTGIKEATSYCMLDELGRQCSGSGRKYQSSQKSTFVFVFEYCIV